MSEQTPEALVSRVESVLAGYVPSMIVFASVELEGVRAPR